MRNRAHERCNEALTFRAQQNRIAGGGGGEPAGELNCGTGDSIATRPVMQLAGDDQSGIHAGGYDLTPTTLDLLNQGHLDFTIDQQPYLQGFLPTVALFLYKLSGGLQAPPDTNTGLLFVTKQNVSGYLNTKTRFEGSSDKQQVVKA